MGQAKPNKKRRIKGKIISESKYRKKDPKVEFDPDGDDNADNDIPEDLSMPKHNENAGQAPLDLTRKTSSLEFESSSLEFKSSSNQVRIIDPPSKSLNLTTPSHKTLPQLAPNYNNQGLRIYPKIM